MLKSPFLLAGGSSFRVFVSTDLSSSRYSIEAAPVWHSGSVLSRYLTVKLCKGSTAKFHLILSSLNNPFVYSGVKKSSSDSPRGSLESTSTNTKEPEKTLYRHLGGSHTHKSIHKRTLDLWSITFTSHKGSKSLTFWLRSNRHFEVRWVQVCTFWNLQSYTALIQDLDSTDRTIHTKRANAGTSCPVWNDGVSVLVRTVFWRFDLFHSWCWKVQLYSAGWRNLHIPDKGSGEVPETGRIRMYGTAAADCCWAIYIHNIQCHNGKTQVLL